MRFDVLSLILGWTLIAISIPLFLCSLITIWLDDFEMALSFLNTDYNVSNYWLDDA